MPASNDVRKDTEALIAKINRAQGWSAVKMGGHWQVTNPDNDSITSSGMPGTQYSLTKFTDDLVNILGWDEREQERLRKAKAKAALDADREANDRRLAEAVAAADRRYEEEMERLRGASLPGTRLPDGEYVGFQRVIKVVTPFEAQVELKRQEKAPCAKRKVKRGNETDLYDAMRNGHFQFTPEDPVFDEHGCLVQGHHRYRTIARLDPDELQEKYGHPGILLEIVKNAPARLNSVYDTGVSRSPADVLTLNGVPKYEFAVMAAIRMLMSYDNKKIDWRTYSKQKYSRDALQEAFNGPYNGVVGKPLEDGLVLKNKPVLMTLSVAMSLSFIAHRDLPVLDVPYKHEEGFTTTPWAQFRSGLLGGWDLKTGDARKPLRDYLMSGDRNNQVNSRLFQFFFALKTLDAWTGKRDVHKLKIEPNEQIPRFTK